MLNQVSVIIPVYNAENFLETAVSSALVHDCVGEVILVDDGSTDDSHDICLRLAQENTRVIVLTHSDKKNKGAAAARNLGIENTNFPLISFLDADDTYYANRFSEAISLLKNNPTVHACFGIVEVYYLNSGKSKMMGLLKRDSTTSVLNYLLKGGYFHTNSITVRKEFFDEVGFFDQTSWPHEDSELWIRMAAKGKLKSICDSNPIASYMIHGNNLSKVASFHSKRKMWRNVYNKVFYLPVGLINKSLILKQLVKIWLKPFFLSK
ncbi:glycosyltransferase family A protein [Algoriphagus aquimarinus]|uniref:glycosyltransferase family 2 protein n=1 Tax=Algoriphagus aquimarinus TaxID=237018 RepID=UPI0030D6DB13|tara:strand:- start:4107 stop:4901 length:795 start_codon:yes stop_codon:yes gene_type:complete